MRIQERLALIDLDASGSIVDRPSAPRGVAAVKFSSGYVAPELVHCNPDTGAVCVRSPSDPVFVELRRATASEKSQQQLEFVPADASQDLWSLGVVIYQLVMNAPLLLCDVDGNCDEDGLRDLARWSELKMGKLKRIADRQARNLVAQLLVQNPALRPSVQHVLAHPFLTGKEATRLQGEKAEFDVFVSYRVATDAWLAELVYEHLTALQVSRRTHSVGGTRVLRPLIVLF